MLKQNLAWPRRRALLIGSVLALVAIFSLGAGGTAQADLHVGGGPRPTIVLVHGDWADGSSTWTSVIERLQDRGFTAVAPPNLLRGPATDAPYEGSASQVIARGVTTPRVSPRQLRGPSPFRRL